MLTVVEVPSCWATLRTRPSIENLLKIIKHIKQLIPIPYLHICPPPTKKKKKNILIFPMCFIHQKRLHESRVHWNPGAVPAPVPARAGPAPGRWEESPWLGPSRPPGEGTPAPQRSWRFLRESLNCVGDLYERAAKPKRLRVGITDEVMVFRRSPYRFTGYLGHSSSTIRSWPCGKGI